jgi:hypothetical protein
VNGSGTTYAGSQVALKNYEGYIQLHLEQVKEYTKEISQMRREYNREKIKLEYQGKTLQKDLKKKIEKK